MTDKPNLRPERPFFSSGPTAKRPGWTPDVVARAPLGRSNRSVATVSRLKHALSLTRQILGIPAAYQVFMTPGSNTGAFEAAMWNLLGPRPVQVLAFESFGQLWAEDAVSHLKLEAEVLRAPYGELPDLGRVRTDTDLVFPWNGTTSGVRIPEGDFPASDREGLLLCDATSAAFCMNLPWGRLDAVTFSFQKALGGEAGIGVLCLSPKAVARLNSYDCGRALPKVMRLKKDDAADAAILGGDAINTFSFMVIEDYVDALEWGMAEGGLGALMARTEANAQALGDWVAKTPWVDYVAARPDTRSTTAVCLKFTGPDVSSWDADRLAQLSKRMAGLLEAEAAAFDIQAYRAAPPGLRIWCGPTVDTQDIRCLTLWLDWAYAQALNS